MKCKIQDNTKNTSFNHDRQKNKQQISTLTLTYKTNALMPEIAVHSTFQAIYKGAIGFPSTREPE